MEKIHMVEINSVEDIKKLKCYDGRLLPKKSEPCIYFILLGDLIVYIGQTRNNKDRFQQHKNWVLYSILINKRVRVYYSYCEENELIKKEAYFIQKFKPSLNTQTRSVVNKGALYKYGKKQKLTLQNFILKCLTDKRNATIVFRLPMWMKNKIEASGKSFADYIIAKLGEDMFKPNEGIDQEAWQKEVAEW